MTAKRSTILATHEGTHRHAFTGSDWLLAVARAHLVLLVLFVAEALESFSRALVAADRIAFWGR